MFAPGRILVQQDHWKDSDNLKIAIENNNQVLPSSLSSSTLVTTATSKITNSQKKTPNQIGQSNTTTNTQKSSEPKSKIDFSLFEDKQSK